MKYRPSLAALLVASVCACGVEEVERPRPALMVPPASGGAGGGEVPPQGGGGGAGRAGNHGGTGGAGRAGDDARKDAPGASSDGGAGAPADAPDPGGPPLSGITVQIAGMEIPKEKAIVLLHLGHSNMAGRALGPAEEKPHFYDTDPHLWQYQKGGVWKLAKEPLSGDGGTPGHPAGAGPGMALLHRALALAPDAHVISIGSGKSLDFGASCFSFRKGGVFFETIMGPARELKGKVTFGGVFLMLGYDARTNPRAQNGGYLECLKGLAADYRAELEAPDLPYIESDYERGASGTWSPKCCGAPQVIAQLAQVPAAIPRSFLIPTDGLPMQDDHHYDMTGHRMWADRAFQGMIDADLVPWATAK